jgi:septal ring factor EnvC (AmiA/AmiB activator)
MSFKNIASSADVAKQLINGNKARPVVKASSAPQVTELNARIASLEKTIAGMNEEHATVVADLAAEKEAHEKTQAALTAATAVPNGEQTA